MRSKEYWTIVVSRVVESTEGVVLTDTQKIELEGLKLKDLKAKNYLFQAIDCSDTTDINRKLIQRFFAITVVSRGYALFINKKTTCK